jgi:ABC-2 type transport system permease protein
VTTVALAPPRRAWLVVAGQELRDLWLGGRGLALTLAYSLLLSVMTYLTATNSVLNFLEQREAVNLTLQVAVAVGALLVLLGAADALSGERERGTLESLLLAPVHRLDLVVGKGIAALSLWLVAFVVSIPYIWFLGRGVGLVGVALGAGFLVGSLLALFLAGLGLLLSSLARSNRVSLSVALFLLFAFFVPTQLPSGAQQGWAGDLFLRLDPFSAGLHYLGKVVVDGHGAGQAIVWLASPLVAAAFAVLAAFGAAGFLTLALVTLVFGALIAAPAQAVTLGLDQRQVTTKIGRHFTFVSTVANTGTATESGLVAHLNVLSDDPGVYVDPEDWSSNRTRYLPTLAPHQTLRLTWTIQAVNSGQFAVYVAVLPRHGAGAVVTSAPLRVSVEQRQTLNAGGVLPLVLSIPAALGLAVLGTARRSRALR